MDQASKPSRSGRSCLLALALLAAFCGWVVGRPHVDAARLKGRLAAGMSLGAVAAVPRPGAPMIFINQPEGAPRLRLTDGAARIADEQVDPAALDGRAAELKVQSISFVWTAVPVRPAVTVTFGPDGRVDAVR